MTVTLQYTPDLHSGDGIETVFAYNWLIESESELIVTVDGIVVFNYAVAGVGVDTGGTVTFDAPPAAGTNNIVISRDVASVQTVDLKPFEPFPAETVEQALDDIVRMIQDLGVEAGAGLMMDPTGAFWDAEGLPISNLADAVAETDATTLQQVTNLISSIGGGGGGGGGISTYIGSDPGHPPALAGDLWIDTGTPNRRFLRRSNGVTWADAFDQLPDTNAAAIAALALSTAGNVYQQDAPPTEPPPIPLGSIWLDSNDGNAQYIWSGSGWDAFTDEVRVAKETTWDTASTEATQALIDAAAAGSVADSKVLLFYQSSQPAPAGDDGDIWIRTTDNRIFIRDSGAWIESQDEDLALALSGVAAAAVIFYQPTEPTPAESKHGDLWIDSDDPAQAMYSFDSVANDYVPVGNSLGPGSVITEYIVANGITQLVFLQDYGGISSSFNSADGPQVAMTLPPITPQEANAPLLIEAAVYVVGQNNVDLHRFDARLQVNVDNGGWTQLYITREAFVEASEEALKLFTVAYDVSGQNGLEHLFRIQVVSDSPIANGNIVWADPAMKVTELKR